MMAAICLALVLVYSHLVSDSSAFKSKFFSGNLPCYLLYLFFLGNAQRIFFNDVAVLQRAALNSIHF